MLKQKNNLLLTCILLAIVVALVFAFIVQYVFDHKPCQLCLYERIPYFISVFLIILTLLISKYRKIILLILALIFLTSVTLSFYHFGIEQGFFNELNVCGANNFSETLSKEELLQQLEKESVSCKDVNFTIAGLSLASINGIFSLFLSVIFAKLFINYGKN
jgi:disulfide bond formation protein DsbB